MAIHALTGEKAAEFQRVYAEYAAALAYASDVLTGKGMGSPEFREADAAAAKFRVRLRELRGDAGDPWMS